MDSSVYSFNGGRQRPGIPVDELRDHIEKLIGHLNPAQPESSDVHEEELYGHQPEQEDHVKPAVPEGHDNFIPAKHSYGQKAKNENRYYKAQAGINYVEIRGTVLCKSGIASYTAIPGKLAKRAIARITCPGWNENGYEYAPFSISSVADEHGFYSAAYPVSKLPKNDWTQLMKECKVFPEISPLEVCYQPIIEDGEYLSNSCSAGDTAYYNAGSLRYTPAQSSHDYPKDTSLPVNGGY